MRLPFRLPLLSLPDRIRAILASHGLSLADISRASRSRFSGIPLHHIPHNFYDAIRKRGFSPSLYQLAALSALSGYRFLDWLEVLGFSLDDVPRFQACFAAPWTVELDARVYHPSAKIPWFRELKRGVLSTSLVPVSQWLASIAPRRFDSLSLVRDPDFRYVKIGSQDAFAFPDLLPGSIVRVSPCPETYQQIPIGKTPADRFFLVEHSRGLTCSRLYRTDPKRVVLCSRHLPYAPVELELGTQATVLGAANLEIRPIAKIEKPSVPPVLGRFWTPNSLTPSLPAHNVGRFIRAARMRSGLSFREASERTRLIARTLRDSRYFCAAGSLSDYEARELPPRHIHKLISIGAVYFASAAGLLEASGVLLESAGELPIPSRFLENSQAGVTVHVNSASAYSLEEIERRYGPFPYFLHKALPSLFGLPGLSVRDVFWAGGVTQFLHPYLKGAAFLVVDRKRKSPQSALSSPLWAQPLYVLLRRDGTYLCGSCSLQNSTLIIRPSIAGLPKLLRLRNRVDAEIVGQIVAIVRRLV